MAEQKVKDEQDERAVKVVPDEKPAEPKRQTHQDEPETGTPIYRRIHRAQRSGR